MGPGAVRPQPGQRRRDAASATGSRRGSPKQFAEERAVRRVGQRPAPGRDSRRARRSSSSSATAPEEADESRVSRMFLGTQLQCARCHDHPYDAWTQKDFYGMAGFFVRLVVQETGQRQQAGRSRSARRAPARCCSPGPAKDAAARARRASRSSRSSSAATDLDEPPLPKDFKEPAPKTARSCRSRCSRARRSWPTWVTAPDNPYFAKAAANRVWAQFMGRGIVHPVDDFSEQNEPSLPGAARRADRGTSSRTSST